MDKNTVTGFILIGVVFVVFSYLSRPSQADIEAYQRQQDSIAAVQKAKADSLEALNANASSAAAVASNDSLTVAQRDSLAQIANAQRFGAFASASQGEAKTFSLSNDSIQIQLSSKGAQITEATLRKYQNYRKEDIQLIRPGDASFDYAFKTLSNHIIQTKDLYFSGKQLSPSSVSFSVNTDNGGVLELIYTLKDDYLLDLQFRTKGLESVLASGSPYLDATWSLPIYQNEKSDKSEQRYSGLAYKPMGESVDKLSTSKDFDKNINGKVQWIAFRDMFFSTIVYAPDMLDEVSVKSEVLKSGDILKHLSSQFSVPLSSETPTQLTIFMGPHDYKLLRKIDKQLGNDSQLARVVDMGDWFRFINVWLIIPIFNFLETITSNYGLIILLLTLFIKLMLSPFTYKSYVSQAKMRVLRPQVEAINEKYPGEENMMKRQQETMSLYKRAGASQLGGCLPMLLQMPFLIAMYQYFPTSLNLRGESFLWAQDLSTYDDVIRWSTDIPFITTFFGNHISLFCLLMTITQVVYMRISQANTGQAPVPGMKLMPYLMSIMFFVFLNQNASGLSYYYLLSMLIAIIQTYLFRYAINEKKLLAKMEANKKKPVKKSKWMQRIEEMQKQQMELQKQKQKNARK